MAKTRFQSADDLIADYVFSPKEIQSYSKDIQLAIDILRRVLTTHGTGGKFLESVLCHRFNMKKHDNNYGWDAFKNSRPVEIKTETINATKNLNCEGSFAEHKKDSVRKKDLFLTEDPILYSVGICDKTGKCIYIMETDISKVDRNSTLFKRLDAKAPRIRFQHWKDSVKSYRIVYKNDDLIRKHGHKINEDLLDVLGYVLKSE